MSRFELCDARVGDLMCGKWARHGGPHRDGVALWHGGGVVVDVPITDCGHCQGPITDAQVEAAAKAMFDETYGESTWDGREPIEDDLYRRRARAALEAAREVS